MRFRNLKSRRLFPQKYKEDRELRKKVYERDNFICCLCGITPFNIPETYNGRYTITLSNGTYLVVDHIIPWKKGGTIDIKNLQTLCMNCNSKKGNR